MQTNQFKELKTYLQSRIVSLTKSHEDYKQKEDQETDEPLKLYYNACAATTWTTKDEVERALIVANVMAPKETPSFQVISYSWYKTCASPLKVEFASGDVITIELAGTAGLPSDQTLDILLARAEELSKQFNDSLKTSTIEPQDTSNYGPATGHQ